MIKYWRITYFFFLFFLPVYALHSAPSVASDYVDSLILITKYDTTKEATKANIYYNLLLRYSVGNLDSGKIFYRYLNKSLDRLKNENITEYYRYLGEIIRISLLMNRPDTSLANVERGLQFAQQKGLDEYIGRMYFRKGIIKWYVKDYPDALTNFLKAEKLLEKNDLKQQLALTYNYIADIFVQLNDFNISREYIKKAIIYTTKEDLFSAKYYTLRNLGVYFLRKGEYEKAEEYLLKSKNGYNELKKWDYSVLLCYNYLAELYLDQARYEEASEYLKDVLTLNLDTMPRYFLAGFYKNIGRYYFEKDVPQKAVLYLKKYIDEFSWHYFKDPLVYKLLGNAFYAQNKIRLGFYFQNQSYAILDSIAHAKIKQAVSVHDIIGDKIVYSSSSDENFDLSFSDIRNYYFKAYKYYIIPVVTIFVLSILYLMFKLLFLRRRLNAANEDIKGFRDRIKRLERSLKEVEEFSEERADLLKEAVEENVALGDKLEQLKKELSNTYEELKRLKQNFSYTVKGPVNNLINLLEVFDRKALWPKHALTEELKFLIKRVRWLIILYFGKERISLDEIKAGKVDISDLISVIIENMELLLKRRHIQVKTVFPPEPVYIAANEVVFARVMFSLFNVFFNDIRDNTVEIALKRNNGRAILKVDFYGKEIKHSQISYIINIETTMALHDLRKVSKNIYGLGTILFLFKEMGSSVDVAYHDDFVSFELFMPEYAEDAEDEKGKLTVKREFKGHILIVNANKEEKVIYKEFLTENSKNVNIEFADDFGDALSLVNENYKHKKMFDLILLKVSVYEKDIGVYKNFVSEIRKRFQGYNNVPVVAVIEDFADNFSEDFVDYFTDVIIKPFDAATFIARIKSSMKIVTYYGKFE